jgi:hypothetical protein
MRRTWWLVVALLAVSGSAKAQKVQLELRPKAGDTLRMRLDQSVEVSGTRDGRSPVQMGSRFTMFSRAIVEGATASGTRILAITDSITMDARDEQSRLLAEDARRQLVGRQMRLLLTPDGLVEVADDARRMPREVSDLVAVMPASFPREPLAVGDTWMRQMPIPPSAQFGIPLGGLVRARFRLDSLSPGGSLAYVSMRGTVESASGRPDSAGGNVSGSMVVNRRRGWLLESRFLVLLRASVVSPGAAAASTTNFRVKVTQHLRVSPGRVP